MSAAAWLDLLREDPSKAVAQLLSGAASVVPFERARPHEFLLAVLPRNSRRVSARPLGDESTTVAGAPGDHLKLALDKGLQAWLLARRGDPLPAARKLSAFAAQVCEALQWPLYFDLPNSLAALKAERAQWLVYCQSLSLSAYRDPEFDYWQILATTQNDDSLQCFWQSFINEAGRTRSLRYVDLGLLGLAQLPLDVDDSLRNLRLQVQALSARYKSRRGAGSHALADFADKLRSVRARNLSMTAANYQAFLVGALKQLTDDQRQSVFALLGMGQTLIQRGGQFSGAYRLKDPASKPDTDRVVGAVERALTARQAWDAIRPLIAATEDHLRKSGVAYFFVTNLDRCIRALCNRFRLSDPEISGRVFQWIHLSLQLESDNPRLWMLWELALRQAGQPMRAQWVLWEMTRRFPEDLPCRVELAQLLANSGQGEQRQQAYRLLNETLSIDADHLHALSALAKLVIEDGDYARALRLTERVDPRDGFGAVLHAEAYARRGEPGDLDLAIHGLQLFVNRYPGQVIAKDYLGKLLALHESGTARAAFVPMSDERAISTMEAAPETDLAWLNFAHSLQFDATGRSVVAMPLAHDPATPGVVLPLPQALTQAMLDVTGNITDDRAGDDDVLGKYDDAQKNEFPIETRLWHYLRALQSPTASAADRRGCRLELEKSVTAREQASEAYPERIRYFRTGFAALRRADEAPVDVATLRAGELWLKTMLDSHRPLPAPILA